jgi:uncharacterized integral membrane protein
MSKFRFILIIIACFIMISAAEILLAFATVHWVWPGILFGCANVWLIYALESYIKK